MSLVLIFDIVLYAHISYTKRATKLLFVVLGVQCETFPLVILSIWKIWTDGGSSMIVWSTISIDRNTVLLLFFLHRWQPKILYRVRPLLARDRRAA